MNVNDDILTEEDLQYLIEELSPAESMEVKNYLGNERIAKCHVQIQSQTEKLFYCLDTLLES